MAFRNTLRTLGAIAAALPEAESTEFWQITSDTNDNDNSDFGQGRNFTRGHIAGMNGMNFESLSCNEGNADVVGRALLLHGFPYNMDSFRPVMRLACREGWHVVAYNQRGYSANAPTTVDRYNFELLREDVFNVADALQWNTFNLVGWQMGALLGYYVMETESGRNRVITFTSLSWPHPNLYNDAVAGPNADPRQELIAQSAALLLEENSSGILMGNNYPPFINAFDSPEEAQTAVWWLDGAVASGIRSIPRVLSREELDAINSTGWNAIFAMFPEIPAEGRPARLATYEFGNVSRPFLYAAGTQDQFVDATSEWAKRTREFAESDYAELYVDTRHWILDPEDPNTNIVSWAVVGHWRAEMDNGDGTSTLAAGPVRELPPFENPPPLLQNSVFWVMVGVVAFAGCAGAYVAVTGNEEEEDEAGGRDRSTTVASVTV